MTKKFDLVVTRAGSGASAGASRFSPGAAGRGKNRRMDRAKDRRDKGIMEPVTIRLRHVLTVGITAVVVVWWMARAIAAGVGQ